MIRRGGALLALGVMIFGVGVCEAPWADSSAQVGGYLIVAPRHVVPGEVIRVGGQVPLAGPPPCHGNRCPGGSEGGPQRGSVHSSRQRPWTTLTWRVHTFSAVLGRVRGHGRDKTFYVRLRVPANTPIGRVLIVGRTPGLPNIQNGSVVVVSRNTGTQAHRRGRLPNTGLPENDLGVLATMAIAVGVGVGTALRARRVDERL